MAILDDDDDILQALLTHKDIDVNLEKDILIYLILTMEMILKNNFFLNIALPLFFAISKENYSAIKILLNHPGIDINHKIIINLLLS